MRALGLHDVIEEHVETRKRNSGMTEAQYVEAIVVLLASGGECMDDIAVLGADNGLLRRLEMLKLPSADAVRQLLLPSHDEAAVRAAAGGRCRAPSSARTRHGSGSAC